MKYSPTSAAGFTLTEMLIVLVIVGILASLALPNFKSMMQSQRVKNASYELYSALSLARSEAIKRNTNVRLTGKVNAKAEVGWDIAAIPSSGAAVPIRTQDYISGVAMRVCNLTGQGIAYGRNGRAKQIDFSPITSAPTFEIYAANTTAANTPFVNCLTIELSGMPRTRQGVCPPCPP